MTYTPLFYTEPHDSLPDPALPSLDLFRLL